MNQKYDSEMCEDHMFLQKMVENLLVQLVRMMTLGSRKSFEGLTCIIGKLFKNGIE